MNNNELDFSQLTDKQREDALKRYEIILPYLNDERTITDLAQEHKKAERTLQRWINQYLEAELYGLARKTRSDKGNRRSIHPELELFAQGLRLKKSYLTYASIYRQVEKLAKKNNWSIPSYDTVYDVVTNIPHETITFAHEGKKAYEQKYEMIQVRECEKPNEIWQADHTLLDIYVLDDDGNWCRPWLMIIIDDYSRAIAGYYVSLNAPSAATTALTLHQAIWRKMDSKWYICGIPDIFYTDNGSDFISEYMRQVGANIKMQLVFSQKGKPRGRGKIERFFRTVNEMCLMDLDGYIVKGKPVSTPKLTLEVFKDILHHFLIHKYNYRIHGGTKIPPSDSWVNGNFIPRMPEKRADLDLMLLTVAKTRQVRREGIRFENNWYRNINLAAFISESVVIRYDPRDMAEISVFYEERFICRAICEELSGQQISLKEVRQARNQKARQIRKDINTRDKKIKTYLSVQNSSGNEDKKPISSVKKLKRYRNE